MTNNIYVIYNNKSKRYGECMAYPTDEFAIYLTKNTAKQGKIDLNMCEICRIGKIDIDSGAVEMEKAPVRLSINIEEDTNLTD